MYENNQFLNIELTQISEALTWSKAYGFGDYTANFTGVNLDTDITESKLQKDITAKLKSLTGDDNLEVNTCISSYVNNIMNNSFFKC